MGPIFRKRRRSLAGRIFRIGLGLCVIAVIVIAIGFVWLRTGLPQTTGEVALPGLAHPVSIYRDAEAVPHIFAQSADDAYEALGFLHAQDRLFQMDLTRHVGAGRLAEWFGSAALDSDRMMRTLNIGGLAKRTVATLSPEEQSALAAYARGVNAYLDAHTGAWPPEYYLARATPEHWEPADSLIWPRLMAMNLGANWSGEELHALLKAKLSDQQYQSLFGDDQATDFTTLQHMGSAAPLLDRLISRSIAALPESLAPTIASNAWSVDGSHTASGHAILANDPHLGFSAPGIWYLAEIDTPEMKVAGVTAPSTPLVVLGQNEGLAWAATTTSADTQDLFVERIAAGATDSYDAPDGPRKFETREEIIHVHGAADDHLTVRSTRHGPVISDLKGDAASLAKEGYVIVLSATMLAEGDTGYDAFFHVNRAHNWDEFREAMRSFRAPIQNFMAADHDGHIGLIAAGTIPIRGNGDGMLPVPGWDGVSDWVSTIPFDQLPQRVDPDNGRLVNANNRVVGPDYPYLIAKDWNPDTRARRIDQRLGAIDRPDFDQIAGIQGDIVSLVAREVLPLLAKPGGSPHLAEAKRLLAAWDGQMAADRLEPLIYATWLRVFDEQQFLPAIRKALEGTDGRPWTPDAPTVARIIKDKSVWCGDGSVPVSCDAAIDQALETTLTRLQDRYGADMTSWRWGTAHPAQHDNPVLSRLPVIGSLFSGTIAVGGDGDTVDKGAYRFRPGTLDFGAVHGPSFRAIYDLGDRRASRVGLPMGESGHPFSRHYDDFLLAWSKDEVRPLVIGQDQLSSAGAELLVLKPESHP